ncbi:pimeloyl-ACP methyl ester carboxylesterase [Algoriphagus sp. 4150]|uniref:alpha/beta fold hydrolase n=1 Tax=Algoriphagus sp. 4150 TaxID=2817756 RepID=UPI002860A7FC|nr:alpha/beta hydrolase [Algoriphagus sp. 4150]MDR7130313.1 pimeloyl-ACP methyl ester carboxylesterase [Algoriphagus sp. 4150]
MDKMKSWYDNKLVVHLLLIIFFPVGLYMLWKSDSMAKWWKITATFLTAALVILALGPYDSSEYTEPNYSMDTHQKLGLVQHELINNDCRLTYWVKNNEKENWIVFLHGAGADHRMFLDQAKAIDNYNLLLIDGRGQGRSNMIKTNIKVAFADMIDDVIQIMDNNGLDKVTLVAQSLGASLAQEIAFQYPDRVSKLVLIGCYNHLEETGAVWKIRNVLMTTVLKAVPWEVISNKFGEMTSVYPAVRDYTIECLNVAGRDTWKNLGISAYEHKHQVDVYDAPHETLLIRGDNDYPEMLSGIYSIMMEKNPLTKEVVISNAGHICNMENIAEVNNAIKNFIK